VNLLLAGDFEAAERDRWHATLAQAMPQHHLVAADELFDRTRIEVAIVATRCPAACAGCLGCG